MKILVTGSRNLASAMTVVEYLDHYKDLYPDMRLVVGDCPTGADQFAREWARSNDVPVSVVVADWKTHGKAAGPLRNQRMVDTHKPDHLLAFFQEGEANRGTRDCVRRAQAAGINGELVWVARSER